MERIMEAVAVAVTAKVTGIQNGCFILSFFNLKFWMNFNEGLLNCYTDTVAVSPIDKCISEAAEALKKF